MSTETKTVWVVQVSIHNKWYDLRHFSSLDRAKCNSYYPVTSKSHRRIIRREITETEEEV